MASPFSGPRRRPPCLRTQPATPLLLLFEQGPCPRPPAPRRPSPQPIPAVSSLSPSLSRSPPTGPGAPSPARPGAKEHLEPPPPAARRAGLAHYLGTPCLPLLSSGGSARPSPRTQPSQLWPRAPRLACHSRAPKPPFPDSQAAIAALHRAPGLRARRGRRGGAG